MSSLGASPARQQSPHLPKGQQRPSLMDAAWGSPRQQAPQPEKQQQQQLQYPHAAVASAVQPSNDATLLRKTLPGFSRLGPLPSAVQPTACEGAKWRSNSRHALGSISPATKQRLTQLTTCQGTTSRSTLRHAMGSISPSTKQKLALPAGTAGMPGASMVRMSTTSESQRAMAKTPCHSGDAGCTAESTTSRDEGLSAVEAFGEGSASRQEQMNSALAGLQRQLEEHEQQMQAKCTKLSEEWEMRFTALEKAVDTDLGTANDRLASFAGLAKVLEESVQEVVLSSTNFESLSRRIGELEESTTSRITEFQSDMACLARELANDRAERPSLCSTQGAPEDLDAEGNGGGVGAGAPSHTDSDRLLKELNEERNLRLQLALQVQNGRCDLEQLRVMLDTTNDHLSSLTRELGSAKECRSGGNISRESLGSWSLKLESLRTEILEQSASSILSGNSPQQSSGAGAPGFLHGLGTRLGSEAAGCMEWEDAESRRSMINGSNASDVSQSVWGFSADGAARKGRGPVGK